MLVHIEVPALRASPANARCSWPPPRVGSRTITGVPRYDSATALVIVDVQNDFADPAGSLYVRGGEAVVPVIDDQVEAALATGAHVYYTQDWHPPSTPHFARDGGIWPAHCVADTWGAQLHPGLRVAGPIVRKGQHGEDGYSGFTMRDPLSGQATATELEGLLRAAGVQRLVVVGLATDYCVQATVLDACALDFEVTVLTSAIRAVDLAEGDGERAVARMREAGAELEPAERAGGVASTGGVAPASEAD
jgi:nicotinamidase/pyrazinamidase